MARKKNTPQRHSTAFAPMNATPITLGLRHAKKLLKENDPEEAAQVLMQLKEKYPDNVEILEGLQEVALYGGNIGLVVTTAEEIVALRPEDPEAHFRMGQAYMTADFPALGLREFRLVTEKWPKAPGAKRIQNTLPDVEARVQEIIEQVGFVGEDGLEDACLHETIQVRMNQQHYEEARAIATGLLAKYPNFAPIRNNLAQSYYAEGNFPQAIAVTKQILDQQPDNIHALSNLARYQFLGDDVASAKQTAERLKASEAPAASRTYKILEALAFLGDDEGVLQVFHREFPDDETLEDNITEEIDAECCHLAAVAYMRQENEEQAERFWELCLRVKENDREALSNLMQLENEVGERDAPWPFTLHHWFAQPVLLEIKRMVEKRAQSAEEVDEDDEEAADAVLAQWKEDCRAFQNAHPDFLALVPHYLDRGDPAFFPVLERLLPEFDDTRLAKALRDFALGQKQSDQFRLQIAQIAVDKGVLNPGSVRLWHQGEWKDVTLYGFTITDEPTNEMQHSEEALDLMEKGINHLKARRGAEAEAAFRAVLEIEPDAIDAWNNLSAALSYQGKDEEAREVIQQVHEKNPDYAFGRINLAIHLVQEEKYDEARKLVAPLLAGRQEFHSAEFLALCRMQLELAIATKEQEAAQRWLDIWMQSGLADEEDPLILQYILRVGQMDDDFMARLAERFEAERKAAKKPKRRGR